MTGIAIGELSVRTQVKIPTIRYYEQIGLLDAPNRTEGKQRRYGETDIERLEFIRNARELGFEVEAIRELMDLDVRQDGPGTTRDIVVRHHLEAVQSRIDRLVCLRKVLEQAIGQPPHLGQDRVRWIQALAGRRQEIEGV